MPGGCSATLGAFELLNDWAFAQPVVTLSNSCIFVIFKHFTSKADFRFKPCAIKEWVVKPINLQIEKDNMVGLQKTHG